FLGFVSGSFASIHFEPSGRDHDFSFCFERLALYAGDSSRVLVLCRWKKHGHKTLAYHLEDCLLLVIERTRDRICWNNCEMVAYLRIVKNALVRLHPIIVEHSLRERIVELT